MAKKGLTVDGGVIDSGYIGEVNVILYNRNKEGEIEVKAGDRVAQIIFPAILTAPLVEVDELHTHRPR